MELKLRDIKINELDESYSIERGEIFRKLFEQIQDNLNAALHDAMANYLGREPIDDDFKRTVRRPYSHVSDIYLVDGIILLIVNFGNSAMVIRSHFLPENWQPEPMKQYEYIVPDEEFKDGDGFDGDSKTWLTFRSMCKSTS